MASNSYDVDFDVEEARRWNTQVEDELQEVSRVLKQVSEVCTTVPGEKDTIMNALYDTGRNMAETWENLANTFVSICEVFLQLIDVRSAAIKTVVEAITSFASAFGL